MKANCPKCNETEPVLCCENCGHKWPDTMKYNIGDQVIDEDGCKGYVCIRYDDGDLCFRENDAAHPNPIKKGD